MGTEDFIDDARSVLDRIFDSQLEDPQQHLEEVSPVAFASLEVLSEAITAEVDRSQDEDLAEIQTEYAVLPDATYSSEKWYKSR